VDPDCTKLLSDSEEHFVVLRLDQGYKEKVRRRGCRQLTFDIRDELGGHVARANRKNDCFDAMNGINLEVDFFGTHLLFEEGEGVYSFYHF